MALVTVSSVGAVCTHVAMERTHVAETRLLPLVREAKSRQLSAALPAIAHENPLGLAKLLKRKDQELAERVGFELCQVLWNL